VPNRSVEPHLSGEPKQEDIGAVLERYHELVQLLTGAHPTEIIESSVTMAQMKVLMLLSAGESRMSDLAAALHLSLSTVTGLVDRLVDSGLSQRHHDPADRRQVIVKLTADGAAFLERFQELGASQLRQLLTPLSPGEVATVRRALELLITAARQLPKETNA
jgi:DNA-binding MarR family transcriptional regulator